MSSPTKRLKMAGREKGGVGTAQQGGRPVEERSDGVSHESSLSCWAWRKRVSTVPG